MNKQKTGIFSGSFNPVHIRHLTLADYFREYEELNEIWFTVSPQNPLRAQEKLWNDELRLELVKLSISDYPRFQALDFEFHLPRPLYSVCTLEKLRKIFPGRKFYFIIGSDNWERFGYWCQSERIIKKNQTLVCPRPGFPVKEEELLEAVRLAYSPVLEIGPAFIREALDTRKGIRYSMYPEAWEAIQFIPLIDEE